MHSTPCQSIAGAARLIQLFSAYNTGSPTRGIENGYAMKVVASIGRVKGAPIKRPRRSPAGGRGDRGQTGNRRTLLYNQRTLTMNGIDPGTIANTALTYFGGAAGAEISGAAIIITWLLCAAHFMPKHAGWIVTGAALGAWTSAWVLRTIFTWA